MDNCPFHRSHFLKEKSQEVPVVPVAKTGYEDMTSEGSSGEEPLSKDPLSLVDDTGSSTDQELPPTQPIDGAGEVPGAGGQRGAEGHPPQQEAGAAGGANKSKSKLRKKNAKKKGSSETQKFGIVETSNRFDVIQPVKTPKKKTPKKGHGSSR